MAVPEQQQSISFSIPSVQSAQEDVANNQSSSSSSSNNNNNDDDDDDLNVRRRRRVRHDSDDEGDQSPPRQAQQQQNNDEGDQSPPRRGRAESPNSPQDQSPPRQRRQRHDSPSSPPIMAAQEDDLSPRRGPIQEDKDQSPPRHKRSREEDAAAHDQKKKKRLPTVSIDSNTADIVYRDPSSGKKISYEEYKKIKEDAKKKEFVKIMVQEMEWGRGWANKSSHGNREEEQQAQLLVAEDPMAHFLLQDDGGSSSSSKKKKKKSAQFVRPMYRHAFPPNRFSIRPGHRWDGVVRGNGFEKSYFIKQETRNSQNASAYHWASEDM